MMKKQPEWVKGSFLDNLDAAALRLGYRYLPLAWGLAKVNWPSTRDRDDFLNFLTKQQIVSE
jgi:hypothetical protein